MKPMHKISKRQGVYIIKPNENDHFIGITAQDISAMSITPSVIHIDAKVIALARVWLL